MKKILLFFIFVCLIDLFFLNQYHSLLETQDRERSYSKYVSEQPGVQVEIFNNLDFSGYPASTHVVQTLELFNSTFPPFDRSPISANVKGFLKVPQTGTYSLELASDDGALLYIDGKRVLNNWGFHSYEAKKTKLFLSEGDHFVLIRYRNRTGASGLKFAWGLIGERHSVGEGELYLAKNLPFGMNPFEGVLAKKILFVNQLRAMAFLVLLFCLVFFIWGKSLISLFHAPEFWLAVILFVVALGLRGVYYFDHLYLRIQGIMDGGDYHSFVTTPINFVTSGEFVSFNSGNLGLLVPLVGIFYKFFHFFPGLHYFSLLMVFSGALLCLFPWLLLRSSSYSWVGLVAGIFLAINPILIAFKIPYVSSDPIGLFIFALGVTLSLKALSDNKWSSYLWAGFVLGLLPIARTVYIPSAPIFAFSLILLGQKRGRALLGFILFVAVMGGYELLAQTIVKQPYYMYFIQDGFSATVVHRTGDQPQTIMQMILWLPRFLVSYGKLIMDNFFPDIWNGVVLRWGAVLLLLGSFVLVALKQTRLFLFLAIVTGIYLFEISSYHLNERLAFPVVFVLGLILALGLKEAMHFYIMRRPEERSDEGSRLKWLVPILLALTIWPLTLQTVEALAHSKEKKEYYTWLKKELPEKDAFV